MLQVEMWERFSWFGMRAILVYFITDTLANGGLGLPVNAGQVVMASYGAAVLLMTIPGGIFADRILGPWVSTLWGGLIIMTGHVILAIPQVVTSWIGLVCIAIGTGFIKPNLSTVVGGLYDDGDPRRDQGFLYFYMSINTAPSSLRSSPVCSRTTTGTTSDSSRQPSVWPWPSWPSSMVVPSCATSPLTFPIRSPRVRGDGWCSRPWESSRLVLCSSSGSRRCWVNGLRHRDGSGVLLDDVPLLEGH